MKKLIGGLIAGAALAFSAMTAQAETVKIGVAAEPYPPYSSKDASGTWVGWEIDLYKAVCQVEGLDCQLVEVAWDGIIPALQEKKIDVIWSSMTITDKRKEVIDFTQFYYDAPTVEIGPKSDDTTLRDKLSEGIKQVVQSGEYDKITAKYPELEGQLVKPSLTGS